MSLLAKIDFGNEAGDDADPDELTSYFVEQKMFREFIDPRSKMLIATAKKGVGKSALIQWLSHRLSVTDSDALIVKCRGAELARSRFNLSNPLSTPNDHIRDWMIRICAIINRHLAAQIKLALTDDSITLVESAELDGFKSRNLVSCLIDRFTRILEKRQPTKLPAQDELALLKRVQNRKLWILIDDLDATFQNTNSECLALGTFFSACRYLTQDVKDVSFRITMRTDVWPIVRRYDEAQDKTEQYVREIVWEEADFLCLLSKRIRTQAEAHDLPLPNVISGAQDSAGEKEILQLAFVPKMPWGEQEVYTYRVIYTLSYHRPRWAIQLCKLAQQCALNQGDSLISRDHINEIWGEYGKRRISDLVSEHKHQCSTIEELINGFRGCDRLLSRQTLLRWIENRISNHITPVIEGKELKSPVDIAHFLYRIGFIVARSEEADRSYEHYHFSEMPDFLTSRTNTDFNVKWEIHPCYREALDIRKINQSQRIKKGLKPVPRRMRFNEGSLLPPLTSSRPPVAPPSSISCGPTPAKLAFELGKKHFEVLAELTKIGVFVEKNTPLDPETVRKVTDRLVDK